MRRRVHRPWVLATVVAVFFLAAAMITGGAAAEKLTGATCAPCPDAPWAGCLGKGQTTKVPWFRKSEILRSASEIPLKHQPDLPVSERVLIRVDNVERVVSKAAAAAHGYTIVDLSDDWVPTILKANSASEGDARQSRYAERFKDLANNRTDIEGNPLPKYERNYLEVYGIPPTLSVLRGRFLGDEKSACLQNIDYRAIADVKKVNLKFGAKENWHLKTYEKLEKYLARIKRKLGSDDIEALAEKHGYVRRALRRYRSVERQMRAQWAIELRLRCEGLIYPHSWHRAGWADYALARGILRFRRKHKLFEMWGLRGDAMTAFAKRPLRLNFETFKRVMQARVSAAADIIEDGTVFRRGKKPTYVGKDGKRRTVRNLSQDYLDAALKALNLEKAEDVLAFFEHRPEADFRWLRVGIRLPEKPEYYSDHMDLKIVVDRGTVWYDYPWKANGKPKRQKRPRMPTVTLVTHYQGQKIPLIRWPTTIGGWHTETDGTRAEFKRYKNSDTGSRVIRDIVAAPVWFPPPSTPSRTLVSYRKKGKNYEWKLKTDLLGPGHRSAYGLVAGYLVIPGKSRRYDYDRGIRIHGSSNYLSITRKKAYSHGCHRMRNGHATRLFGFILAHRNHGVDGHVRYPFKAIYKAHGRVFRFKAKDRGFRYVLDPPLPVKVLRGDVRSRLKRPPKGKYPMPNKLQTPSRT